MNEFLQMFAVMLTNGEARTPAIRAPAPKGTEKLGKYFAQSPE